MITVKVITVWVTNYDFLLSVAKK